jgi:TPR repeat protein
MEQELSPQGCKIVAGFVYVQLEAMRNPNFNRIAQSELAALAAVLLLGAHCTATGQEQARAGSDGSATTLENLNKSARAGDASAQFEIGRRYEFGIETLPDAFMAARCYRLAAKQGLARAEYSLGRLYFSGDGVPQNQREAAKYFRRAAGKGYALAQHRLARTYELGQGVVQNLVEAYRWYSLSAENLERSRMNLETMTARMTAAQLAQARTTTNQIAAK